MADMRNRLADATSPYLLQHGANPVHWQPWDAAALAEAREEKSPCVIVAEVEPHHYLPDSTAWVDIEPAEVSGFTEVRAVREQYEIDKAALQRLHY